MGAGTLNIARSGAGDPVLESLCYVVYRLFHVADFHKNKAGNRNLPAPAFPYIEGLRTSSEQIVYFLVVDLKE